MTEAEAYELGRSDERLMHDVTRQMLRELVAATEGRNVDAAARARFESILAAAHKIVHDQGRRPSAVVGKERRG